MLYDLAKPLDVERIQAKLANDIKCARLVAYEQKALRTTRQNSYLHLLLGAVALETGNPLDYVKQEYFKVAVNPNLFILEKQDSLLHKTTRILRSSRDLTTEEMSTAIDRFKKWASENGIYLPEPGDADRLREIAWEMDRAKRYL